MSIIDINNLSVRFRLSSEPTTSLKELIIKKIKKQTQYVTFEALSNISFKIDKGDVLGVVGVNGAGKSSLLKIIAGVIEPTTGNAKIDGIVTPLLELGSGFDHELTGAENVYLNGALLGYSKKFIEEKYDEIVKFAELDAFMHEKLCKYSSGMVARLAFSIATAREAPEILLLDEILSVGDMFFRKKSVERMDEMIKGGSTVIIVSHSIDFIKKNCTKVLWLEKGKVKMFGDTEEVCSSYIINK